MAEKKKVNIGFDIGITSVGWAIVDTDNNIIDRGVRLFEELKNPKDGKLKNQQKREKRHQSRTIGRRVNRKNDFIKLITKKYSHIFGIKYLGNVDEKNYKILKEDFLKTKSKFLEIIRDIQTSPLELALKGLKEELEPIELAKVLYWYLAHRGYSYKDFDTYLKNENNFEIIANNSEYKKFAEWYLTNKKNHTNDLKAFNELVKKEATNYDYKNDFKSVTSFISSIKDYLDEREYHGLFPSVIQSKEFEKKGFFRGNTINNSFSIHQWKAEIKKLLSNQSYITKDFIDAYIDGKNSVFSRLREFAKGPGSEKSRTPYGVYRFDEDGNELDLNYLWEATIGKCSVYPNEDRTNKKSVSSEISNLLSQLNTLEIKSDKRGDAKLSEKEKKDIIFKVVSGQRLSLQNLAKWIDNCEVYSNIYHYPTKVAKSEDKSSANANFESMENSKKLFSLLSEKLQLKDYDSLIENKQKLNDIVDVFAKNPEQFEAIESKLIEDFGFEKELAKQLIESKIESESTSSMSLKALDEYIKDEIVFKGLTINQKFKSIIDENKRKEFNFSTNSKYINIKALDDEVMSPTTKCSIRETFKVFNKILKRFIYNGDYLLNNIVIEMPTEWNSVDERKRIKEIQKANEDAKNLVKENFEYTGNDRKIIEKLKLLLYQDKKDIYTGEPLDYKKVISYPSYSQVDHIVPRSFSYDDSINNKVLVSYKTNQEKGQRTPKEYLKEKFYPMKKIWEELYLEGKTFENKKKFELLTIDLSSSSSHAREIGFIGRNLADTRYACRMINTALITWIETMKSKQNLQPNEILLDGEVNVINVNGKYTQTFRTEKFLNLKKDRDDYRHHAVDATICAILGNSEDDMGKLVWFREFDLETGEVKTKSRYIQENKYKKQDRVANEIKWKELSDSVANSNVKFSYKINKKGNNFSFYGDSLISVRKSLNNKKFEQAVSVNFLDYKDFTSIDKDIQNLKKEYIDPNGVTVYPDKKLWDDLMKAYEEGNKLRLTSKELEKKNPFELYTIEFYKNFPNTKASNKCVPLKRGDYIYFVKSLKYHLDINSFIPANKKEEIKMNNLKVFENFAAYSKVEWKEIRLYKDSKEKYRLIPIRINMLNDKDFLDAFLNSYKIDPNSKFYTIHKGMLMVNKKDSKDIRRVAGLDFIKNLLDLQEIYKSTKQNQVAINTIMENYNFCSADELGNITIIEDLGI